LLITAGIPPAAASNKSIQNSSSGYQGLILTNEEYLPTLLKCIDEAKKKYSYPFFLLKPANIKTVTPTVLLAIWPGR